MDITSEIRDGTVFISVSGRIDGAAAGGFQEKLLETVEKNAKKVAVDMSGLDYVNSSGLRVFLMAAKTVSKMQGRLVLYGMKEQIREVFDMTGFLSVMTAVDTLQDAVTALS